jgi:hypothetical protein
LILCGWSLLAHAAEDLAGCQPVARVVSLYGTLQLQRAGRGAASNLVKLGTQLCQNDLLRAGAPSRATLFISVETLVRVDQNSTMRVSQTEFETVVEFIHVKHF